MGSFLVLGGVFNCVEKNIDRKHVEPHMASRRKLIQMIETNELCDVWRNFNYRDKQYTVHGYVCDNLLSMARLDFMSLNITVVFLLIAQLFL